MKMRREIEIGEGETERVRERERTKYEKIKKFRVFFCKNSPLWRHVACHIGFRCVRGTFGTPVKHLMYFRDPDG